MSGLRLINLGLPKSGTTTLARALRRASLETADHRIKPAQIPDEARHNAFVGQLMYDGYFSTGDPLALMPEFVAFSEINALRNGLSLWPQMDFGVIDAIRHNHPSAVFVQTWRPAEAISDSMQRWSNLGDTRLPKNDLPGLPLGYGGSHAERVRWIEAHDRHLDQIFRGSDVFLRLDVAAPDARQQLSDFIDHPIKWWGHANRSRPLGTVTAAQNDTPNDSTEAL